MASQGVELARASNQAALARQIASRKTLYQRQQPYRLP